VRIGRVVLTPGWLFAIATAAVIAAIERSATDVVLGLAGAVTGLLAGVATLQLGVLAAAAALGVGVQRVVIGLGPRLAEWGGPARPVVLRAVPLFLSVVIGQGRTPVRRRMWAAALCSVLFGTAVSVLAVVVALGADLAFLTGSAAGTAVAVGHALVPSRTAGSTSPGWLLLRLPRLSDRQARQLETAGVVGQAVHAARAGELDTAERLAAHLAAHHPDLRSATAARIVVLKAQGRYPEAMVLAVKLACQADQEPHEAATSLAVLAGLACTTVEAGQLDTELGLSTATRAMDGAQTLGYPSYQLNGARALEALLRGNPDRAICLARLSARSGDDVLCRADDLATLARAHMAAGDNRSARRVLSEAEKLAPWWPRVARTRSRLEVC
jgi:hypothetical protein